jgi:hypothetical protein
MGEKSESDVVKIPYFLPIFLSKFADEGEIHLEILTFTRNDMQLCRLYKTILPKTAPLNKKFPLQNPILTLTAN